MRTELKSLQRKLGITFIHVTHSQDEAMALSDEIVLMNMGEIEQAGHPREVFNAPRTEFVARFIGNHNIITQPQGRFAIRSDRIRIAAEGEAPTIEAAVGAIEYQGTSVAVTVNGAVDTDLTVLVNEEDFFAAPLNSGETVGLIWNPTDLHELGG